MCSILARFWVTGSVDTYALPSSSSTNPAGLTAAVYAPAPDGTQEEEWAERKSSASAHVPAVKPAPSSAASGAKV